MIKNPRIEKGEKGEKEELPKQRTCATEAVHNRLLVMDPDYARRRAASENRAWAAVRVGLARVGCTRIPVVVHVVHRTAEENISQAQIDSQITVLNQDYRARNADRSTVPNVFASLIGDARVEFALATTDPQGQPTNGVTRTKTNVNGFTDNDNVKSAATGGADAWPANQYLNIWVCRLAGGLLGYAQFPGGPAATDGVVITHTGFGTTGTAAAPFNLGRTTTHEVGHWLNLHHIWGDDGQGCNGSDFVNDTPNQGGANYGTPTFPTISCQNGPNGDMFMNYMDYVDDVAMVMFSLGQVTRMQTALDVDRAGLGTSIPCGVKIKFTDEPVTLKFRDDPIVTTKFCTDPIMTRKILDDPIETTKMRDDLIATSKNLDDTGTSKHVDDVKSHAYDKHPTMDGQPISPIKAVDEAKAPAADKSPRGDVIPPSQVAPFILATPHHSRIWEQTVSAQQDLERLAFEERLAFCERVLRDLAAKDALAGLSEAERAEMNEVYRAYIELGAEYQRLYGGR